MLAVDLSIKKRPRWRLRGCRTCGGDLYLAPDEWKGIVMGYQWQCLQCGRVDGRVDTR